MSEKLVFQICYGPGDIFEGSNGVDFSGFPLICKGISRPDERTIHGVRNWILRLFGLDPEQHTLHLRGLVSRRQDRFYGELIDLNATSVWRKYVEKARQRDWPLMLLAQAYPK